MTRAVPVDPVVVAAKVAAITRVAPAARADPVVDLAERPVVLVAPVAVTRADPVGLAGPVVLAGLPEDPADPDTPVVLADLPVGLADRVDPDTQAGPVDLADRVDRGTGMPTVVTSTALRGAMDQHPGEPASRLGRCGTGRFPHPVECGTRAPSTTGVTTRTLTGTGDSTNGDSTSSESGFRCKDH